MSLAGHLSDLSLADLLQTIALSRKSGVLEICSDSGVGWLGLRDGGIVRVALSDKALERAEVLEKAGLAGGSSEEIDGCLWDAAVDSVLQMFEWHEGDFTFDSDADPDAEWRGPEGLMLQTPISADFLALEGARLCDENGAAGDWGPPPQEQEDAEPGAPAPGAAAERSGILIAVDPDYALLETVKEVLRAQGTLVHIFADPADGLNRYKQYVMRGQVPILMVGEDVSGALPERGVTGWQNFVWRVRRMVPHVAVILLRTGDGEVSWGLLAQLRKVDLQTASEDELRDFLRALTDAIALRA